MQREATSDVQLFEDLNHEKKLPKGDFMECFSNLIMGETEDYDICLVPNLWHFGGGKDGYWQVDDILMVQTACLVTPKAYRGKIHDSEFIANRLDPKDWVGVDFSIAQVGDSIVWKNPQVECTARPPYWQLKGDHMGVQYDVTLGGIGEAFRVSGPWEDLPTTLRGGYDHRCWAEGTITVKGQKYELKNAWGLHERFTFGSTYDPVKGMADPYNWVLAMSEAAQLYFFVLPGEENIGTGKICINGEMLSFGMGEISVKDTELWVDPLTQMQVPVKWEFNLKSNDGVVRVEMVAGARGVFTVESHSGTTVRYAFSCQLNGEAIFADGRKVAIENVQSYMEWGKTAFPIEAGI